MGLTWTGGPGGYIRKGCDANGRFHAHVSRLTGTWIVYVAPWGSGLEGGLAFGRFDAVEEAMDAADRHVVAFLDSPAES